MQALVTGKLTRPPEKKISAKGNSYLFLTVKQDDDSIVRVSLFGDLDAMSMLQKEDVVAAVGELRTNIWDRNGTPALGLTLIAHRAISASERKPYQPRPKPNDLPTSLTSEPEVL